MCVASYTLTAQSDSAVFLSPNTNVDSLKKIYGKNKVLLKEYELQILTALSYYPELLNERIKFLYSSLNSTAQTTVIFSSIFNKNNRQYIIFINEDIIQTGLLLHDAPFDAQVAVIGHELAHVADFKTRRLFGMIWWGLNYQFVKQRTRIELRTDESTIEHGLGWPLYHWADFVLNHSNANKRYIRMKGSRYMLPDEILQYMKKYESAN